MTKVMRGVQIVHGGGETSVYWLAVELEHAEDKCLLCERVINQRLSQRERDEVGNEGVDDVLIYVPREVYVDCPWCEGVGSFYDDGSAESGPFRTNCTKCAGLGIVTTKQAEELKRELHKYDEEAK